MKCPCFFQIFFSFSLITRGRTWSMGERDVIDSDVSCLSSHCSLQNHLVDSLQGHMTLYKQPLIPLVSPFLPHLQKRQEVDSLVTMRMWGGFCNTAICTETVPLAHIIPCINAILQSVFHNHVKSIITERNSHKYFSISLTAVFSNSTAKGSSTSRLPQNQVWKK